MTEEGQQQDILVDIPDEDLPELAEMYKKHQDWAPHHNSFNVFYFSLGDCKSICEAFRRTKRLEPRDYTKDTKLVLLYSIHQRLYTPVKEVVKETGKTLTYENSYHMLSIPCEEALRFEIECPEEVYMKQLDTTHAHFVNSLWPHRYEDSEKYVALLIEMNDSYGLFLKSTGELVCWVLLSMLGQLNLLQTVDAHKRKGYASIIVKHASKEMAKKGYSAFGTIFIENEASVALFRSIGFRNLGIAVYATYE
ncbi:hypothetical protein NQ315_007007 [Exocentrus adspersus]|uniref:N-acetyltransferase domain-containing protein n=1 Tax=Exocentrus adspersus TaxID=1586481 RepID=A0AAV8WD79_9CUCU|nr:hypothetical protein NQ315_007007 [Exocentrus adspersus]